MSNICEHFKVTCGIVVVCETWGEVDLSKCFSPVEGHQNEVNWSKDNNFSPTGNFLIGLAEWLESEMIDSFISHCVRIQ